ncbi:MAG: hypothetical protein E7311_03355 [Clostridiales bacterium]|nr:hypothetical protein [Clostridiales bacterium]
MQREDKKMMVFQIAVDTLIEGKTINTYAFSDFLECYSEKNFETIVTKRIKKSGKKDVTYQMVLDKITESVVLSEAGYYIVNFAKRVKGLSIDKLAVAIIKTRRTELIIDLACIKGAPVEKLAKVICEKGYIKEVINFAKKVPNAPIELLENDLIKKASETEEYDMRKFLVDFAKTIKEANITKLEDVIISFKQPNLIYEFAKNVERANINKMVDAIIKLKARNYYKTFIADINNISEDNIKKLVIDMKKDGYCGDLLDLLTLEKFPEDIAEDVIKYAITKKLK